MKSIAFVFASAVLIAGTASAKPACRDTHGRFTPCKPPASAPAGATAECKDGTYSFSKTHSGSCSHHGGVAGWLK
jgi:hypothetical protein